jgi:hypothetical protein
MRCNVDLGDGIRRSERDDADSESELRVLRTDKRRCASRSGEPAASFIHAVTAACASTLDDVERLGIVAFGDDDCVAGISLDDALFREPAQRVVRERHRRASAFSHAAPPPYRLSVLMRARS